MVTDRQAGLPATPTTTVSNRSASLTALIEPPPVVRIHCRHAKRSASSLSIGNSPYGTSPCCIANTAAAARVDTPILLYAFWMWLSAVFTEIPNACHLLCLQPARGGGEHLFRAPSAQQDPRFVGFAGQPSTTLTATASKPSSTHLAHEHRRPAQE